MTERVRTPFRLPLVTQVMGLVLVSLMAAIGIHTAIALLIPPPPPEIYRTSEVASALRAPGQPVTTRSGHTISARLIDHPPMERPNEARPFRLERWMSRDLAQQLNVAPDDVRVFFPENGNNVGRRYIRAMHSQMPPPQRGGPPQQDGRPPPPDEGPPGPDAARDGSHAPQERPAGPPPTGDAPDPPKGGGFGPYPTHGPALGADPFMIAPFEAYVEQAPDQWVELKVAEVSLLGDWRRRVLIGFAVSFLVLAPVAYLFARWLAAPIAGFAKAAERLGRDPGAPPLTLAGPAEVALAANAFNEMQERIRRYVQDRTAMIGSVAHDMRTPLTRLRFRIEQVPEDLRAKLSADLDEMEAMISSTLSFVKDASETARRQKLELRSLVETVALEMAETGLDVTMEDGPTIIIDGDALGLRRMVANLIDNAVKFGSRARLRVTLADREAVIEVDDAGPGLPPADQERVFEPFVRTEPSRSRQTGGAGLGLAVVRSIARAHGGDARLSNLEGHGLRARITLPL